MAAMAWALFFCACTAQAQSSGSTTPRREDPLQRKLQSVVQLEMIEAALTRRPASATDRNTALAQVKEDFSRIQVANDNLYNSHSSSAPIDARAIAKTASEIRMRAKRLKENLALPRPAKNVGPQANPPDLRSSITMLSKLIESFVSNPMLSQKHVVDATLSLQAGRDLEDIISLSGELKKITARRN